ncbi:MAG TPA: hypothetical protein PKV73_01395 [Agriterribacter sp.]|nr:hypothetical protein [Agriterribacter sp.]
MKTEFGTTPSNHPSRTTSPPYQPISLIVFPQPHDPGYPNK